MDPNLVKWVAIHVLPVGQRSRELSREDIFDILSNERRRYVLEYVEREEDECIHLHELVDVVTAAEATTDGNGYSEPSNVRSSVYSALVQTHLPAMDEAGIIDYDEDEQLVQTTDQTREVHRYMEYLPGHEIRWVDFYFALSALFAGIVVLTWLSVPPFGSLAGIWVAAVIVIAFLGSSIAQMLHIR